MGKGFEVKLTGEYIAKSGVMGKERILKNYEITCIVPSTDKVLSVIKNKILSPKLKQAYDDYVIFRTYHILEITPLSPEDGFSADLNNIRYMGRQDLERVVRTNALGVPVNLYPSLFKLREAVYFASNDPKGYAKHLGIHREDLELDVQVAKLNPDLQEKDSKIFKNTAKTAGPATPAAPKKDVSEKHIAKQTEDRVEGLGEDMKKEGELGELDDPEETTDINDL
ncbi:MAG: hypothetical protein JRJ45_00085 [Deltaproteobacteria bacterium]|nr:hypothetical protein [Deltaproteobacteria bacterium]